MDEPSIQLDPADFADEPDVKEEVVDTQETTPEESSTKETKEPEVAEDKEKSESEESETEDKPADDVEDEPIEETEEETQPRGKAEERKQQLNEEIRDLVSTRNQIKEDVKRLNEQVYQAQSPQDLVDEGMSETDAKLEAMRQQIEIRDYNERVSEAQLTIGSESQRVLQDFPIFNPDSEQYKPEVAQDAAQLLRENLIVDPNTGQVIGSNVSPYRLYKTIANANQASAAENQIKGQKATEKMLAAADSPSSAPPKEVKEDPFLAGLTKGLAGSS